MTEESGYVPIRQQDFVWNDIDGGGRVARLGDDDTTFSVVKLKSGDSIPEHSHTVGSYVYVVSGELEIDGQSVEAGSAGYCRRGRFYGGHAKVDSTYIVCRSSRDAVAIE